MGKNDISKLLAAALAEDGYIEKAYAYINDNTVLDNKTAGTGKDNVTKYWRDIYPEFNRQKQPWCQCFVVWCFVRAFGTELAKKLLCCNVFTFSCTQQTIYYKNKGKLFKDGKAGDQIFFKNSKGPCHTGLVYKTDSSRIYTVEGNTSSKPGVVPNGGMVRLKSYLRTDSSIYGYGRPIEDDEYKEVPEIPKSNEEIAKEVIAGKWGTGVERRQKLTQAGYDYVTVQKIVNEMLK